MADFNPESFNDSKDTTSSEGASNVEKKSKAWSNAFSHWVDFGKLQKGIFTDFIEWSIKALFTLLAFIILSSCCYIFIIIYCGDLKEIKELLSQIGSIIISFGGWATASILAIKQKR